MSETPDDLSGLDVVGPTVDWSPDIKALARAIFEQHEYLSDEDERMGLALDQLIRLIQATIAEAGLPYNDQTLYAGIAGVRAAFIISMKVLACEDWGHVMSHLYEGFNHYFGPAFEAMRLNGWVPDDVLSNE